MSKLAPVRRTIADVRAAHSPIIYYGACTCWWSDRPPPYRTRGKYPLPCDPRGGVLMETRNVEGFLRGAEENPEYYGPHGLAAFELALHGNVLAGDGNPTCFEKWEEYGALLDAPATSPEGADHNG